MSGTLSPQSPTTPFKKIQKVSKRLSMILTSKRVARRLSTAVFEHGDKFSMDHPTHGDNIKKQNFITDVHLEEVKEQDPVDDIVEALCNSNYLEDLTQIFQYYSSYGDSYNLTSIKLSNFVKFIRETLYLPAKYPLAKIQVLFKEALKKDIQQENERLHKTDKKSNVNNIDHNGNGSINDHDNSFLSRRLRLNQLSFKGWLRCICLTVKAKSTKKIETKEIEAQKLPGIVEDVINKYIIVNAERLEPLPNADFLLEEKLVAIMRKNTAMMMKIYNYYATPCRTKNDRLFLQQNGLKNLFNEFKVPQTIISKLELFRIWNHVAHEHDLMEFPEFLEVMGRAAMLGYSKPFLNEKHKTSESKLTGFFELFRYNEQLRLIIEENRQLGKQVNMHKMQKHQFLGENKKRRFLQSPTSLHRLYYKFGVQSNNATSPKDNNGRSKNTNKTPKSKMKNINDRSSKNNNNNDSNSSGDDEMSIIQPPRLSELIKHSPPKFQRNKIFANKLRINSPSNIGNEQEKSNAVKEDITEQHRIKQAGGLTDSEKVFASEWDKNSSHLMSSTVASSIFSPLWKADKPLERAVRTLDPYEGQLLEVFEYYCFLNNRHKLNFQRLDSFNWMKLLRDSKLMREDNDSYGGDDLEEEMHDLWISRAEADVIYVDLSTMKQPHGWIDFNRFKLGLARVAHILEHRVGPGGLRHHKINEDRYNILEKKEKRLHDYPQLKSPIKKQFASPMKPRRASMHLTWQPTSPKRSNLEETHLLRKVATESEADRAERLLDLIEDEKDSMGYIHMNQNYREQILDLADSLLIMIEQHVLKYAKRVSCFGYGHEEANTAMEQLNEEQVVAILKEQEMTLQRIFTYYSTKRHDEKPFWEPGEERRKAISYKELETIAHHFKLTPSILTRSEIFMCFRSSRRNPGEFPDTLSYSEWVECFARMGLLAFSKPFLKKSHPLPEHRVHGFFGWLKASEGMNEIENEEWSRGHGYTGVKMTRAFLNGEDKRQRSKPSNIADIAKAHDIINQFNFAMSKIRDHALANANESGGKLNLKKEFKEIDKDGNGTISVEEFVSFIHNLCAQDGEESPITDEEIDSLFSILDPDQNGFITYGEFTYQFYNRRSIVKKLRSDSIVSSPGSSSPTNLDIPFIEEAHNATFDTTSGNARGSIIQPFFPAKYTYEAFFEIKNNLKIACKSWIGDTYADFPTLMVARDHHCITLEEFQAGIKKILQGTDFDGRITHEDGLAIYHLLTRDKTVKLTITSITDFLQASDLLQYGIKPSKYNGSNFDGKKNDNIKIKPFSEQTTKATVASKQHRHPRRNDIIPIKLNIDNERSMTAPTMEEILGAVSDEDKRKNAAIRNKTLSNSKKEMYKKKKIRGEPSVVNILRQQSKISAPKLFIRSPGEMKYLKRMRKATKERERVTKLTTMRSASPVKEKQNEVKTSKVWKKIEKRGSFFGMYKGKNANGNHALSNGNTGGGDEGMAVNIIKGGSKHKGNDHSNSHVGTTTGAASKTTKSASNKKRNKTPRNKSPGTVRRFQF